MIIEKEILDRTTNCQQKLACFNEENSICKVIRCIDNRVLFVDCPECSVCKYKVPFGNLIICNCPTRKEIYYKYHR